MGKDMLARLGPLAALAGSWEGDKGIDISPSSHGPVETKYRESLTLKPMGPVVNGPQELYGLRYATTAWPLGDDEPFHEELGYWLWDGETSEVMRCFMVPRGVTLIAGGHAAPDARHLEMRAEAGSATYGILSNPFLDDAFRTVRYELTITVHDDGSFSYSEDTQLKIHGQQEIFHHTDRNTLTRAA